MMKMNKTLYSLAGILTLVAVGCVKESDMNERFRPEGTPIVFSAATGYENGDATRTEYSGNFFNTSGDPVSDNQIYSTTTAYERIDWKAGDNVKIYYTHGSSSESSVYNVDGITSDAEISDAGVSVAGNNSVLTWTAGNDDHVFTAMYPNVGFDGNNTISFNGVTAGGLIPSSQTLRLMNSGNYDGKYLPEMKYAYMLAYKSIASGSSDHDVNLPFRPAFTAFNFRLRMPQTPATGTSGASYKVKSFTMTTLESGASLAGNFSVDIAGLFNADGKDRGAAISNLSVTGGSASITASFVDANHPDGVSLSNTSDLDFTLLALPWNITKVVLTLTYLDADGTEVTKSVQLGGHGSAAATFDACKKYIITNTSAGFDEWEYVIDVDNDVVTYGHDAASGGFNVVSYKQSKADPTIKAIVPWKIQYTTVANPSESDWNDLTSTGYVNSVLNATFNVTNLTGTGAFPATPTSNTASVSGQTPATEDESGTDPGTAARAKLASATPRGTASAPFDLSRHPFYGNNIDGTEGNINSANCYIVSAPGYYMFPCVYGNSIKDGNINVSSYSPATATDAVNASGLSELKDVNTTYNTTGYPSHYYLPTFRNAWNNPITSPYIWTDCNITSGDESAIVVWQDTAVGDEIIPYKSGQITNPDALGTTTKTVNGRSYMYIWFKVDAENIKPGNIMIALRDGDHIVWSWHIWVTEKDLEPKASDSYTLTLDDGSSTTFTIMPYNLGWLDSASGSVIKYKDRELKYRAIQNDGVSTSADEFLFTQIGDAKEITPTVGGNPYYQWGRKDPLIPSTEGGGNRPFSQNPSLGVNIAPAGGTPIVPSNTADYGTAIQHPYNYYSNNLTTGYVGGTAYPYWYGLGYRLQNQRGTVWFKFQLDYYIDHYALTNAASIEFDNLNGQPSQNADWSIWRIKSDGYYREGPYTQAEVNGMISYQNNAGHFSASSFTLDNWAYTPNQKEAAISSMYNLWNAFIYSDQPTRETFGGTLHTVTNAAAYHRNKFKTIYDPCPAGFAVPTKASYIGNSTITYSEVVHTGYTERWKGAAPFSGNSVTESTGDVAGVGVMVSGQLFPYTGARVCYNGGTGNVELRPEGQGAQGFYWTDNPLNLEPVYSGASDYYNIGSYYFYQHAYIFMFGLSGGSMSTAVQDFTRGSAGSIRPMLEANSNDI